MEITARKTKVRGKKGPNEQISGGKLHFYNKPPVGNVSLSEFQGCAIERLKSKLSNTKKITTFYFIINIYLILYYIFNEYNI